MSASRNAPAPLILPVSLWVLGLVAARLWQFNSLYLIAAALFTLVCATFSSKTRIAGLLLLFAILGALRYSASLQHSSPLGEILRNQSQIQQPMVFSVTQSLSDADKRYAIRVDSLASLPVKANMIFFAAQVLQPGTCYRGLAEISNLGRDPILDIYPSRYSARAYQLGGIQPLANFGPLTYINHLRYKLMGNLDAKLGENSGWAKGLLLSDPGVKREFADQLSGSGIMHLVVVSGLHVWLIYFIVVSCLRIFLARRYAELLFLPLILLFAALNNWAAPISRAIIMIGIGILARLLQRPIAGGQSLALALFIITLLSPQQLFSLGLQMSFVAVAVLIWGIPRLQLFSPDLLNSSQLCKGLNTLKEGLLYSALISLAITPLTLYYFGRASLNGIIGNTLGIPLIGVLLPVAFLVLIVPQAWSISKLIALSYNAISGLWEIWMRFSYTLPFSFKGAYLSYSSALALAVGLLWLFLLVRGRFRLAAYALLPVALLIGALHIYPELQPQATQLYVFKSGVSDCSLVQFSDGRTLMIDTGGGKDFTYTEKTITEAAFLQDSWMQITLLPWLGKKGIKRLDYLVLTHLHTDHCGGLLALLQSRTIGHIFISAQTAAEPVWQFFASRPYFGQPQVHIVADTCSYQLGKDKLSFLHPDKNYSTLNENNRSLVCRLDTHNQRILFTGDIEAEVEQYLVEHYATGLKCDILKVPHHGSKSSSSLAFLQAAKPQEAYLTTSWRNRFGFPHKQVIQRYHSQQIRLESTADGTIRKKIDISASSQR